MDVEDAVVELADEADVVDALIAEVGGVVVEAEGGVEVEGFEGALGAADVEGDFGGMDFEGVADAALLEFIEDGDEALGEVLVSCVDLAGKDWWEAVAEMPDAGAGEAIDDIDAEALGGVGGLFEFFGGALADAFRVAVAVDVVGEDGLVTGVDVIADCLTDEVG